MSSPEAHSRTPHNPDDTPIDPGIEEYIATEGGYAYSSETEGGDASPEVMPLTPEARASYTLEQVQQLWDATDHATRQAIWLAMEDNDKERYDKAYAEFAMRPLKNSEKTGKMDTLEAEAAVLKEDLDKLWQSNMARHGKADTRKSNNLADKLDRKEAKLRRLHKKEKAIERQVENKSKNEWLHDEHRQTESYKNFREAMLEIDSQAESRRLTRARLESLAPDDPERADLQTFVDSWGDTPDEVVYAQERQAAAAKYHEDLATEKRQNQEKKWGDGFSAKDEETNLNVQQVIENYIADEALLNDDSTPQAKKDNIKANRIKNGTTLQRLKNYLLEKEIANPDEVDEAADYYSDWLEENDTKKYNKAIDEINQKVIERTNIVSGYFEQQEIARKIASGEITDDAEKATNEKMLRSYTTEMEKWSEWAAFDADDTLDKSTVETYVTHLCKPVETNGIAAAKAAQTKRLRASGYQR